MINGIIFDLDGTVYRGTEAIPGSGEFIAGLKKAGRRIIFFTNRSHRAPRTVSEQLQGYGIPCDDSNVVTAAEATVAFVGAKKIFCIGEEGLAAALAEVGAAIDSTLTLQKSRMPQI